MKISELITKLEEFKKEHGDVEVHANEFSCEGVESSVKGVITFEPWGKPGTKYAFISADDPL